MQNVRLWVLVVLILVGGALLFRFSPDESYVVPEPTDCPQIVTDGRNPETGEVQSFASPCDVPEGWDTLETDHERFQKGDETWSRYRNDDLGVRFEYRVEPSGYVLIEHPHDALPDRARVSVSLFNAAEYAESMAASAPREGPPAITLTVFENPSNLTPEKWVETERRLSNVGLARSAVTSIFLAGVPAVRYTTDGLYTTDTIVALNNGMIFMITGDYADSGSSIRTDFMKILNTLALY